MEFALSGGEGGGEVTIYVMRRPGSEGATELAEALDGRRVRFYEGGTFRRLQGREGRRYPVAAGDIVVCWGERIEGLPANVRVLNNVPILNKMTDALKLKEAGVPTVEVSRTRPVATAVLDPALALFQELVEASNDFGGIPFNRTRPYIDGVQELANKAISLRAALNLPPPPPQVLGTWLPRLYSHTGGADLLTPPAAPDYYSKKEDLIEEYRVHSFQGKSIKAGVKVGREGVAAPHAWIRSLEGGWRIRYDGFESRREMREVAAAAVKALNLDFGAVDLGRKREGGLIVLEVNRAPGLADGTVNSYARAIRGWRDGTLEREAER